MENCVDSANPANEGDANASSVPDANSSSPEVVVLAVSEAKYTFGRGSPDVEVAKFINSVDSALKFPKWGTKQKNYVHLASLLRDSVLKGRKITQSANPTEAAVAKVTEAIVKKMLATGEMESKKSHGDGPEVEERSDFEQECFKFYKDSIAAEEAASLAEEESERVKRENVTKRLDDINSTVLQTSGEAASQRLALSALKSNLKDGKSGDSAISMLTPGSLRHHEGNATGTPQIKRQKATTSVDLVSRMNDTTEKLTQAINSFRRSASPASTTASAPTAIDVMSRVTYWQSRQVQEKSREGGPRADKMKQIEQQLDKLDDEMAN